MYGDLMHWSKFVRIYMATVWNLIDGENFWLAKILQDIHLEDIWKLVMSLLIIRHDRFYNFSKIILTKEEKNLVQ